jgi:WD40 repeat protein
LRNLKYGRHPDFKGHSDSVTSVAFSVDGKYLASGSDDNTVRLWSVEVQKEVAVLQRHTASVSSIAFSPNGKYLASGSLDKTIILWNVE